MERSGGLQFPNLKTVLAVITGVMMLVDLYFIFMVAPTDAVLGHVQRVFYFHVPIAIMSLLAFLLVVHPEILLVVLQVEILVALALRLVYCTYHQNNPMDLLSQHPVQQQQ